MGIKPHAGFSLPFAEALKRLCDARATPPGGPMEEESGQTPGCGIVPNNERLPLSWVLLWEEKKSKRSTYWNNIYIHTNLRAFAFGGQSEESQSAWVFWARICKQFTAQRGVSRHPQEHR
jgi:hypothetical protein